MTYEEERTFWKNTYITALGAGKDPVETANKAVSDLREFEQSAKIELSLAGRTDVLREAEECIRAGKKINAIKAIRAGGVNLGLKEAKQLVEAFMGSGQWDAELVRQLRDAEWRAHEQSQMSAGEGWHALRPNY